MNSWISVPSAEAQKPEFLSTSGDSAGSNHDPMDAYFECITTCSLDDGECMTSCTEVLRQSP